MRSERHSGLPNLYEFPGLLRRRLLAMTARNDELLLRLIVATELIGRRYIFSPHTDRPIL